METAVSKVFCDCWFCITVETPHLAQVSFTVLGITQFSSPLKIFQALKLAWPYSWLNYTAVSSLMEKVIETPVLISVLRCDVYSAILNAVDRILWVILQYGWYSHFICQNHFTTSFKSLEYSSLIFERSFSVILDARSDAKWQVSI